MRSPFEFLLTGSFSQRSVRARWAFQYTTVPSEVEKLIAESWALAEIEAATRGQELFAGPMTRLLRWSSSDGTLTLDLGPTDYRQFVGTNLRHPELARKYGRDALANPLGVSAAVFTSDGHIVVQRRSEHVFEYPGYFHVCGGNVEPVDVEGPNAPGVFAAVRRELDEELGIGDAQIADITCLGLSENRATLKPDLLFAAEVTLTADAFAATGNAEYSDLVFIGGEASLAEYLIENSHRCSPPGIACLLAAGRRAYGDAWYECLMKSGKV
ncbi:MAG TPA: NUDIX domain-containing protein [Thermomicrobiales bacterium]|nr:NUDIX domain-containing protein [Thermomicrobiales bacterium]